MQQIRRCLLLTTRSGLPVCIRFCQRDHLKYKMIATKSLIHSSSVSVWLPGWVYPVNKKSHCHHSRVPPRGQTNFSYRTWQMLQEGFTPECCSRNHRGLEINWATGGRTYWKLLLCSGKQGYGFMTQVSEFSGKHADLQAIVWVQYLMEGNEQQNKVTLSWCGSQALCAVRPLSKHAGWQGP